MFEFRLLSGALLLALLSGGATARADGKVQIWKAARETGFDERHVHVPSIRRNPGIKAPRAEDPSPAGTEAAPDATSTEPDPLFHSSDFGKWRSAPLGTFGRTVPEAVPDAPQTDVWLPSAKPDAPVPPAETQRMAETHETDDVVQPEDRAEEAVDPSSNVVDVSDVPTGRVPSRVVESRTSSGGERALALLLTVAAAMIVLGSLALAGAMVGLIRRRDAKRVRSQRDDPAASDAPDTTRRVLSLPPRGASAADDTESRDGLSSAA